MFSMNSPNAVSWYGRYFPDKRVPAMPRQCLLSDGGQLTVDYATEEDQSTCCKIISDSAASGKDNVGIDEFSDGLEHHLTNDLLIPSQVFAARDTKTKTSKAFILVAPSPYGRTYDLCLTSLFVFRDKDLQLDGGVFDQLLRLAVDFAQAVDLGYTTAIYSVAACAHDLVQRLRRQGFIRVATIPGGVRIAGVGLCDNFFMVKSISPTRPRRSPDELHRVLNEAFPDDQCYEIYQKSAQPLIDFLPAKYIFANGLAVICRNMQKQEDNLIYEIWKSAAKEGLGYGIDEMPTLAIFRTQILLDHYCVVFEEIATGRIVGLTLITSSSYTRTSKDKFGESSLFIRKEFRRQKLAPEAIWIEIALMKQLGFKWLLNDALASNQRMLASIQRSRVENPLVWLTVGVIPDGCYTEGYGWDDQVIAWYDLQSQPHIKNFTELADQTSNRTISKL